MKINTPTEFLTFKDGFCDIYTVIGNKRNEKIMTLCYGNRAIGAKRFYAARAATTDINRLIQIPQQLSIEATHRVVVGTVEYKIEQVQHLPDSNPLATLLTLRKIGVIG